MQIAKYPLKIWMELYNQFSICFSNGISSWKTSAPQQTSGDPICNESEPNAEKTSNIWICMQLIRHYLKFSIKDSVGELIGRFVGNSIQIFNGYFAMCICVPVVYKYVPILIWMVSYISVMHSPFVEQSVGMLDEIFVLLNILVISLGRMQTDCATHNKCISEVHDTIRNRIGTHF